MTTAQLRPLAETDLISRTRRYRREGGEELGARFFDAAIDALRAVERMPNAGSARVGDLCGIPGLRVRRVVGFPCGWCYFVGDHHIDVVRLLADAQDLLAILASLDDD